MIARDTTERLYQDIKKDFDKLSAVREFGVQKFTNDWILAKLAHQYYKQPKTIENIVFNRVHYPTSQLALFISQS